MRPNKDYLNLDLEFWSNVKLLNQRLGYTVRVSKRNPAGGFVVPTVEDIVRVYEAEGLNSSKLVENGEFTEFGKLVSSYMKYRGDILTKQVEPSLMKQAEAKRLFYEMVKTVTSNCPLPMNKQKGDKKDHSYLTGLVNMLTWSCIGNLPCDYDPSELTALTEDKFPVRTLSRRLDGAFPSVIDPIAIWEIKEYYYTRTFGSRVSDGVYETQLDGWELWEANNNLGRHVKHFLIVDDHFTWWIKGRSHLCRLVDSIHMGLVDEVVFGREVLTRWPEIIDSLVKEYEK